MHLCTHVIHSGEKSFRLIDDHKKTQFKESCSLTKLTLHTNPLVPFHPQVVTISLAKTVLSTNCLPGIKADWKGSTSSSITLRNLCDNKIDGVGIRDEPEILDSIRSLMFWEEEEV